MRIKQILMERDGLSEEEAEDRIIEAKSMITPAYGGFAQWMATVEAALKHLGLEDDYVDEILEPYKEG